MKRIGLGVLFAVLAASAGVVRALPPGEVAPDFKGVDSNGVTHSLSEYRGKFVVLEWANRGCPYEKKHYQSGNMESLQKEWTAKGVVWLSILSDPPGEQGYVTPAEENDYLKTMHASPTAALLERCRSGGSKPAARKLESTRLKPTICAAASSASSTSEDAMWLNTPSSSTCSELAMRRASGSASAAGTPTRPMPVSILR